MKIEGKNKYCFFCESCPYNVNDHFTFFKDCIAHKDGFDGKMRGLFAIIGFLQFSLIYWESEALKLHRQLKKRNLSAGDLSLG